MVTLISKTPSYLTAHVVYLFTLYVLYFFLSNIIDVVCVIMIIIIIGVVCCSDTVTSFFLTEALHTLLAQQLPFGVHTDVETQTRQEIISK